MKRMLATIVWASLIALPSISATHYTQQQVDAAYAQITPQAIDRVLMDVERNPQKFEQMIREIEANPELQQQLNNADKNQALNAQVQQRLIANPSAQEALTKQYIKHQEKKSK